MVEIPMKDLPSFTQEITLDNIPYIMRFDFLWRGPLWNMSFYDRDETPLVLGIPMLLFYELITRYPDRGLPPGELWVMDITRNLEKPGRDDFTNGRLNLVYYEEADLS